MSRLLSRDYIAALAPQGAPNLDVVVTDPSGDHLCALQVKTRWQKGSDGGWHMSKKHETIQHARMFYCFVDLGLTAETPETVYVVPSRIVAAVIRWSHSTWLSLPGKHGHIRKDSNVRRFLPSYDRAVMPTDSYCDGWLEPFREAWDMLRDDAPEYSSF